VHYLEAWTHLFVPGGSLEGMGRGAISAAIWGVVPLVLAFVCSNARTSCAERSQATAPSRALTRSGFGPGVAEPTEARSDVEELSHCHSRADGADQRAHDDNEDLGDDHVVAGTTADENSRKCLINVRMRGPRAARSRQPRSLRSVPAQGPPP